MTPTTENRYRELYPVTPGDLASIGIKPFYQPEIITDMPLLSRLSDRVPAGYYRLGLVYIASEAIEKPVKYGFVRPPWEPAKNGELYVAAIDEERKRYWVLAQVIAHPEEDLPPLMKLTKPQDLARLLDAFNILI